MQNETQSANGSHDNRPPKPEALEVLADGIPDTLKDRPQWVVWRYEWKPPTGRAAGKWDKPPRQARTGNLASTTDPKTWCSVEEALDAYLRGGLDGIGKVLAPDDDLSGADFDKCRHPLTGHIDPGAAFAIRRLDSYSELSPSGCGVRVLGFGKLPDGKGAKKGLAEVYCQGRYLTVTGHHLPDSPATIQERAEQLADLAARIRSGKVGP